MTRPIALILATVCALSLAVRCLGVWWNTDLIFDESYYVHDARVILSGDLGPTTGQPWRPGSERATAHPDLGKMVIAGSIRAFGDNPWGWRLPSILAGAATVALTYPIARRLRLSPITALAATALAAADTLSIAMSRLATLDAQVAFWTAATILAALTYAHRNARRWVFASGVAGGLATATKWSGLLGLLAATVILAAVHPGRRDASPRRQTPAAMEAAAIMLAAALGVYMFTYLPYFLAGHGLTDWLQWQWHMATFGWNVHGDRTFASPPESWLFDAVPIWFRWVVTERGVVGLLALGNPVLFWSAILSLAALATRTVTRRDMTSGLPLLLVAALYAPWLLTDRQSYLYYVLPAVPFLALCVAAALSRFLDVEPSPTRLRQRRTATLAWMVGTVLGTAAWPLLELAAAVWDCTTPAFVLGLGAAAASAAVWRTLRQGSWRRWLCEAVPCAAAWGLVGVACGVAVAYLPFVLGLPVPFEYYDRLMLFPTWR